MKLVKKILGAFLVSIFVVVVFCGVSQAAIAFVNSVEREQYNNTAGGVSSPSQDVVSGNCLVVFVAGGGVDATTTATASDTAGNVFTRVSGASVYNATNNRQVITFVALNVTGNSNDVITISTSLVGYISCISLQFSGVASANAIDAAVSTSFSTGSSATSVTSPSFSTVQADEVACAGAKTYSSGKTFTAGAGFTIPANGAGDFGASAAEYQIYSSVQSSVTASMSSATADAWAFGVVTLKGATSSNALKSISGVNIIDISKIGSSQLTGVKKIGAEDL